MKTLGWKNILIMASLSFFVMYIIMYMMVDNFDDIYLNLNQFYMVMAMTSTMMIVEIILMTHMYEIVVKTVTLSLSIIVFILSFVCIRFQFAVNDRDFLKSMITHHSSAILMCKNKNINDTEIKKLCESIISSQSEQIDWMKNRL